MRWLLDTNVVVSALLKPLSVPARLLDLALSGHIEVVVSNELLAENREVLLRPKFRFSEGDVDAVLELMRSRAISVVPVPQPVTTPDPKDQFVIDLAATSGAVVVTDNTRHFEGFPRVVTPAEALSLLRRA